MCCKLRNLRTNHKLFNKMVNKRSIFSIKIKFYCVKNFGFIFVNNDFFTNSNVNLYCNHFSFF